MRPLVLAASLYFLALALLHPNSVPFDGMSFLRSVREGWIDPGHALYTPALVAFDALTGGMLGSVAAARLLSALGALLAFVLLWRRVERLGLSRRPAGLVAFLFAGSALFWQEAGSVEPTSWTIACLLLARSAAERHARAPGLGHLAAALVLFVAALGFHLVSLCALPWLVLGARPESGRWPRALLVAAPVAAVLVSALLVLQRAEIASFLSYWSGVVLDLDEVSASVSARLVRGGRLVLEGAPVLLVAGLVALFRAPRAASAGASWLGLPYLVLFVLYGKPLVGLLVPMLLALALGVGAACAQPRAALSVRALALAVVAQGLYSSSHAIAWRLAEDVPRRQAELIARHLPEDVVLYAGALSNHLRYYQPEIEVVSLPEVVYRARGSDADVDPIELVLTLSRSSGRRCALSSDGAAYLHAHGADPARLGLRAGAALLIPEDPRLALFPLAP